GLRRAGDVRAAQALLAPAPLLIHNTEGRLDVRWAAAAYRSAGSPDLFETLESSAPADTIIDWLKDMNQ
ncbi:MAG: hypothetical protein JXR73_09430, partial [Candidatus Omnitrophica bacterium]|nr:hypothetical protein [Candidatus Omnitrophota bacterium]